MAFICPMVTGHKPAYTVYTLKTARNRRLQTLGPLVTSGTEHAQYELEVDEDDDNDSGISSYGTGSGGNGSMPSPDLSKTELATRLASASPRNPSCLKARVLWNFEPIDNSELRVEKGDVILLLYRDNARVLVQNLRGQRGFIPFNYCSLPLRKVDSNCSNGSQTFLHPLNRSKNPQSKVSYHDFTDDMSLMNKSSSESQVSGTKISSLPGFRGLKHRSFSEEGLLGNTSSSSEDELDPLRKPSGFSDLIKWNRRAPESYHRRQKVTATHFRKCDDFNVMVLYHFEARAENDVDVRKGDIVTVLNRDDEDWWWVLTPRGQEGFVPSSYLSKQPLMPYSENTPCSVESASSTSEGSSTQAVRFQDPLCTFHRYEKEEWETDSEDSRNQGYTDEDDETGDAIYANSKWSTWC